MSKENEKLAIKVACRLIKIEAKVMECRANWLTNNLKEFAIDLLQANVLIEELVKDIKLTKSESEYFLAGEP